MKFILASEGCEKNKGLIFKDPELNPVGNKELL